MFINLHASVQNTLSSALTHCPDSCWNSNVPEITSTFMFSSKKIFLKKTIIFPFNSTYVLTGWKVI
uniref:Uncharacterized protein n=1 Tax=Anguilla anguilla TaxID=7936 RepID=A0A0E9SJ85_ANGAN